MIDVITLNRIFTRWNSEIKKWDSDVAPLLTATFAHDASVINDKIYVTGGCAPAVSNNVQMFTPNTNTWTFRAPMIKARCDHMVLHSFRCDFYAPKTGARFANHI